MRRRSLWIATALLLISTLFVPIAQAAAKAGATCIKKGVSATSKGVRYTCIKSGSTLLWSREVQNRKRTVTPAINNSPVSWRFNEMSSTWVSQGNVPKCPIPLIPKGELLDFSKVLSIVQPGQIRGGSYKPHAGLRWSEYGSYIKSVSIAAPFDGEIVGASQYISEGNYQFLINIIHPCGVMLRLGHLLEPSGFMKSILKNIPPAVEMDSRESFLSGVYIKKGQVIATEVGMPPPTPPNSLGTFIDLGIVDLRAKNPILPPNFSSNADIKYSLYSVCWYEGDYLSDADRTESARLPFSNGDSASDYCKRR